MYTQSLYTSADLPNVAAFHLEVRLPVGDPQLTLVEQDPSANRKHNGEHRNPLQVLIYLSAFPYSSPNTVRSMSNRPPSNLSCPFKCPIASNATTQ